MEYVFELLIKRAYNKHNALSVKREKHIIYMKRSIKNK